jgi:DNA-binding HxlR family transcriptional regulator
VDYRRARIEGRISGVNRYTDYCPISIGVDVLGDQWTPLIIRELSMGATGFNEIHRGIPRIGRSLLTQRLRMLERRGIVRHHPAERGRSGRYVLTAAGEALSRIVWEMGHWAAQFQFSDPTDTECDGQSLIWRMHQHAIPESLPEARVVVHVRLSGVGAAEGWLDIDRSGMTVCREDQGKAVDLAIEADTAQMYRWLMGMVSFRSLVAEGHARLIGPTRLARAFPTWFRPSAFAADLTRSAAKQSA